MTNSYPRTTTAAFLVAELENNNVPIVSASGISFSIVKNKGTQPSAFSYAATTLSGSVGCLIAPSTLGVGTWQVWARVVASPEQEDIDLGVFFVV
jgi:hypothetical protein